MKNLVLILLLFFGFRGFSQGIPCEQFLNNPMTQEQLTLPIFWGQDEMVTLNDYLSGVWSGIEINFDKVLLSEEFVSLAITRIKAVKEYGEWLAGKHRVNRAEAIRHITENDELKEYILEVEANTIYAMVKHVKRCKNK